MSTYNTLENRWGQITAPYAAWTKQKHRLLTCLLATVTLFRMAEQQSDSDDQKAKAWLPSDADAQSAVRRWVCEIHIIGSFCLNKSSQIARIHVELAVKVQTALEKRTCFATLWSVRNPVDMKTVQKTRHEEQWKSASKMVKVSTTGRYWLIRPPLHKLSQKENVNNDTTYAP